MEVLGTYLFFVDLAGVNFTANVDFVYVRGHLCTVCCLFTVQSAFLLVDICIFLPAHLASLTWSNKFHFDPSDLTCHQITVQPLSGFRGTHRLQEAYCLPPGSRSV